MGNKTEEIKIEKELDDLDEQEIKINLEIYKLQTEVNKRKSKDQQVKLKNNYIHKINKWKSKNHPEKEENAISKYDPYDEEEFETAKKEQENWNKENNENKNEHKKNKEHFLDSGIPKLTKRLKDLEKLEKEEEKNDIRRNKEKIKRNYINELNQVEDDFLEDNIKDELIRNINENLDKPDMNEKLVNDELSELYSNYGNEKYSLNENHYSNDIDLYEKIVKEQNLKDRLYDINIKFLKSGEEKNGNKEEKNKKWKEDQRYGINYEYQVNTNKNIEQAIEKRNHIIKNKDFLKEDISPFSDYSDYHDALESKSDNISQYY